MANVIAPALAGSRWYGNVWLALAALAYTAKDSTQIIEVKKDLLTRIGWLGQLPGAQGQPAVAGTWTLDWGPFVTKNPTALNANLMYVISYRVGGAPYFVAISIRGTDTSEIITPGGLITQLAQDLDVENMVSWQQVLSSSGSNTTPTGPANPPPTQAAIAHGSSVGLNDLLSMTAPLNDPPAGINLPGNIGVADYVKALAALGVPVIVTGHSLGGCQATAMALYLANTYTNATIVPHPFAPPSAGNAAWAQLYAQTFTNGQIWWNTADIVPNAFQNAPVVPGVTLTASMANILNMWGPDYGGALPIAGVDAKVVGHFQSTVGGTYVQLANSMPKTNVQALAGAYMKPVNTDPSKTCGDTWLTQLMLQHFPPMYSHLMNSQLGGTLASFATPPEVAPKPTCTVPNGGRS